MAQVASNLNANAVDVVDIKLLQKETTTVEKEDSSLDSTLPTSCDSSQECDSSSQVLAPAHSCDDSVGCSFASNALDDSESRRVSFSFVEVLVFPRILGDNPSVSEGPPLAIGNTHCARYSQDVDEYERQRDDEIEQLLKEFYTKRGKKPPVESPTSKSPRRRRKPFEFNVPCRERIMILHWECSPRNEEAQAAGTVCTGADIKRVIRETQKTKRQRHTSKSLREFEDLQVKLEGYQRKMKKMLTRKSKQESELEQWANAGSSHFEVESSARMEVKGILKVGNTCPSDEGAIHV